MSTKLWTAGAFAVAMAMAVSAGGQQPGPRGAVDPVNPRINPQGVNQQPGFNPQQPGFNPQGNQSVDFRNDARGRAGANPTRGDIDHEMIRWLIPANQEEIQLGRLATSKASNENVKQFANMLVQDHTRLLNKLKELQASAKGMHQTAGVRDQNAAENQNREAQFGATDRTGPANANVTGAAGQPMRHPHGTAMARDRAHHFIAVLHDVQMECGRRAQQELSQKQGAMFDQAFVGKQIDDHINTLATLSVFERSASPALQLALQEASQVVQGHLDQARQLIHQLAQTEGSLKTGTRSSRTTQ